MKYRFSVFSIILTCVVFFISCQQHKVYDEYDFDVIKETSERYKKDEINISKSIIENIEANRLFMIYERRNTDSLLRNIKIDSFPNVCDYAFAFTNLSILYYGNKTLKGQTPSLNPAETQTKVYIDTLLYSADSLKCAAIVIIKNFFDPDPRFKEPYYYNDCPWNGFAFFGIRENIDELFNIYPIDRLLLFQYPSGKMAQEELREEYFNCIGTGTMRTAGTEILGTDYKLNFGEAGFFEQAPDFKKDSTGHYYCEYIWCGAKRLLLTDYYSNRKKDSTTVYTDSIMKEELRKYWERKEKNNVKN